MDDKGSVSYEEGTSITNEFGALVNCLRAALCKCISFVKFNESHLLYLGEMLDRHDLHCTLLQMLDFRITVDDGVNGVPSVLHQNDEGDILYGSYMKSGGSKAFVNDLRELKDLND